MDNETNLTLINDVIYHINGNNKVAWLQPAPILISNADSWTEAGNGRITCRFALNRSTDLRWRVLFSRHFDYDDIKIQGTVLLLTCHPDSLTGLFAKMKAAILAANADAKCEYLNLKTRLSQTGAPAALQETGNTPCDTGNAGDTRKQSIENIFRNLV
jgi:hypothetical protein